MKKIIRMLWILAFMLVIGLWMPEQLYAAEILYIGRGTVVENTEDGKTIYRVPQNVNDENRDINEVKEDYIVVDNAKYSVDGKRLLAIPRYITRFNVKEGTEIVNLSAIIRYGHISNLAECEGGVKVYLECITFPKSLKAINFDGIWGDSFDLEDYHDWSNEVNVEEITFKNDNLSAQDLSKLLECFVLVEAEDIKAPKKVSKYKNNMFIYKDTVVKYSGKGGNVSIPEGVKRIGKHAFTSVEVISRDYNPMIRKGANVKSVTFPKSLKAIEKGAFFKCKNLASVNFKSATKLKYIGEKAFYKTKLSQFPYCENLKKIGDSAFYNTNINAISVCKETEYNNIGTKKLKVNVKEKKSTVKYKLKKGVLTISGKGHMPRKMTFINNKKIKKVIIKKGVTSIPKRAFYNCKNLKKVTIASTVKDIGEECFAKTKIKFITIPKKVKVIGQGAFNYCKKLKNITMPGSVSIGWIDESEYYGLTLGCNVTTIKFNTALNTDICDYIESSNLSVMKKDPKYKSIKGVVYTKDGKSIVEIPVNQ